MMNQAESRLWNKIENYIIAGDQNDLFIRKLMQQEEWSRSFTKQAILEYKRFMFLAVVSPRAVTPCPVVDVVWHLHLVFSRCYWDNFCGQVLNKNIHHDPSDDISDIEKQTMSQQYQATLFLYRIYFSHEPAAVWGGGEFESKAKKSLSFVGSVRVVLATLLLLIVGPSVYAEDWILKFDRFVRDGSLEYWFTLIIVAVFVGLVIRFFLDTKSTKKSGRRRNRGSGGGADCGSSCNSSCGSSCGGGD